MLVWIVLCFFPSVWSVGVCDNYPALIFQTYEENYGQNLYDPASSLYNHDLPLWNYMFVGSHDAGDIAGQVSARTPSVAESQCVTTTATFTVQLCRGVRWFDLRWEITTNTAGQKTWSIFHRDPFVDFGCNFGTHVTIRDELLAFMKSHPKETLFLRMKFHDKSRIRYFFDEFFFPTSQHFGAAIFPAYTGAATSTELGEFLFRRNGFQDLSTIPISQLQGKIVLLDYGAGSLLDKKGNKKTVFGTKNTKARTRAISSATRQVLANYQSVAFSYDTEQDGTFSDGLTWALVQPGQQANWDAFATGDSPKVQAKALATGYPLYGFWYTVTGASGNYDIAANSLALRTATPIKTAYQSIFGFHADTIKVPTQAPLPRHTTVQYWPNFIILDFVESNPDAIRIAASHNILLHLLHTDPTTAAGDHNLLSTNLDLRRNGLFTFVEASMNVTGKLRRMASRIHENAIDMDVEE